MNKLTPLQQRRLAKKQKFNDARKSMRKTFAFYNRKIVTTALLIPGDTTVLPFGSDNRKDVANLSLEEILHEVMFPQDFQHRTTIKGNDVAPTNTVLADYMRNKLVISENKRGKAYKKVIE